MSAFTLHSIGDTAFLAQVLNAVAMTAGSGDLARLAAVGALAGLLIIALQSLMAGGRELNVHHLLVSAVAYLCLFGPTATVVIEDAYAGGARTVSGVPLGVAASGAMISGVGYGLTRLFEQAYGEPDRLTERAFAEALQSLARVRERLYWAPALESINAGLGEGADIAKTLA
ncbi:MAG: conjugal transfer protein TraG N-terminal domain-containing protein, partial [Duodenibacillus sp.]|nr:conjugal transfer protein TraG N-terminal domain-containing protein [Duodenibacillus sp.]